MMKCERCGHEVSPSEKYCPVCGNKIQMAETPSNEIPMITTVLSILLGITFFLFVVMLRVSYVEHNANMIFLGPGRYLTWAIFDYGFALLMLGVLGLNVFFLLTKGKNPKRLMIGGVLILGHLALTLFIRLLYLFFRTTTFSLWYIVSRSFSSLLILTIPLGIALIAYGYMLDQGANDKESRTQYVLDISRHNPALLDQKIREMLQEMGYREVTYKDEVVFKRGTGFLQAIQMIKVTYHGHMIIISGWICYGLGSLYLGESDLEGTLGVLPKRATRNAIEKLITLL